MSKIYKYPNSIEEAATLLDEANLGWADRINLDKLYMSSGGNCILGQLYGSWIDGMSALFALNLGNNINNPYVTDTIFGHKSSDSSWKEIIKSRAKEPDYMIQGLGLKFNGMTGMMVRNNQEYNLVMDDGNQWASDKIPTIKRRITKSELEKLYQIRITDIFPAKFELMKLG